MKKRTNIFELYEKGKEYNHKLDLYNTVDKNERFYVGDQWKGVVSNGLPTPVFNIFKRVINHFVSSILASDVKVLFTPENIGTEGQNENEEAIIDGAKKLSMIFDDKYEKLKMRAMLNDAIRDAAVTGDAIIYTYWNGDIDNGQDYKGDIDCELIDNTNVFFGNPNNRDVNSQPYILISGRELTEKLRKEARDNGVSKEEINKIVPDNDTEDNMGDLGKIELEGSKTTYVIKFEKDENGQVFFEKATEDVVIRERSPLGIKHYPIAVMNWDKRKNSWHGVSLATSLIENQIYINKGYAMIMKHMMDTAFSKIAYDANLIDEWNNQVGGAVAVNRIAGEPISNIAAPIGTGVMQSGMLESVTSALNLTKEMLGATDAYLGNLRADNASAIIALQNATNVPLDNNRRALYQFIEDIALIWLDFILNFYDNNRLVTFYNGEKSIVEKANLSYLKDKLFRCNIEAGASTYYSEVASLTTLDNLLKGGHITLVQYLERIPDSIVPDKQKLIDEVSGQLPSERSLNI